MFKIRGNRPHIRTEKEMVDIDRDAADEAFKKNKKRILDQYFRDNGFVKYKTNAYVRKSKIDTLEYVDIQKERYGSKTFTINFSLMPLYVPHEYLVIGFGSRLGENICHQDVWWDYATEEIAEISFRNVVEALDKFVLPWFEKYSDERVLFDKLLADRAKSVQTGRGIPYKNSEWIEALEKNTDRAEIMLVNMTQLKLPQKIMESKEEVV